MNVMDIFRMDLMDILHMDLMVILHMDLMNILHMDFMDIFHMDHMDLLDPIGVMDIMDLIGVMDLMVIMDIIFLFHIFIMYLMEQINKIYHKRMNHIIQGKPRKMNLLLHLIIHKEVISLRMKIIMDIMIMKMLNIIPKIKDITHKKDKIIIIKI